MHVTYCQVCQSQVGALHLAREMAMGTRDSFPYFECSECGCLSLAEIPPDLDQYYPRDYCRLRSRSSSIVRKIRNAIYLSPFSFLVNWRRRIDFDLIRCVKLKKDMAFLEVGGRSVSLLCDLRELGYNASGINPFVRTDVRDRYGVTIERKSLAEVKGTFDVILFRHALEHMPIHMLRLARDHIKSDGVCVVCIPLLGWAWKNYSTDWVELDAPRHLFVHSSSSISLLATKSGFTIEKVIFDSTEFQFWASDFYQRDVPMTEMPAPTRAQRNRMRRLAEDLNQKQQGDTAQFYLRPV
jgi:hypothetical protein